MFDLNFGELFIVAFITIAVVSAPWWPRFGEWVAAALRGDPAARDSQAKPRGRPAR